MTLARTEIHFATEAHDSSLVKNVGAVQGSIARRTTETCWQKFCRLVGRSIPLYMK